MKFIYIFVLFLFSCSITNQFNDEIPYKTRFDDGLRFFEEEKYNRAIAQFNIIVERATHTDLGDDALFFLGESYFLSKQYDLALIEFEKLVTRMGFSPYLEKSRWRICESLMALSPNYFHDQDSSLKAIIEIQQFLDDFPNSDYSIEADKLIKELRLRLAQKNMESGYLYVKLKAYDSAIKSFKVVVNDYYDTQFIEDAHSEIIKSLILLDKIDESDKYFDQLMDNPAISSDIKSRVKKLTGKS